MAVAVACGALRGTGHFAFALSMLESGEALALSTPDPDPAFLLGLRMGRTHLELLRDEPGRALAALSEARRLADVTRGGRGASNIAVLAARMPLPRRASATAPKRRSGSASRSASTRTRSWRNATSRSLSIRRAASSRRPHRRARALLEAALLERPAAAAGVLPRGTIRSVRLFRE